MSTAQFFEFILKFNGSSKDPFSLGLGFLVFSLVTWGLGSFWGTLWNKEWSLVSSWSVMAGVIGLALLAGYSTVTLRKLSGMQNWFEHAEDRLSDTISKSGKFNRNVAVVALGQPTAGNTFSVDLREDAFTLAKASAEETLNVLSTKSPFKEGVPLPQREDCKNVAVHVSNALPFTSPQKISPDNERTEMGVRIQVKDAISKGFYGVNPHLKPYTIIFSVLLALSIALPAALVAWIAYGDIKANPNPN
jgi:hypothetical protein